MADVACLFLLVAVAAALAGRSGEYRHSPLSCVPAACSLMWAAPSSRCSPTRRWPRQPHSAKGVVRVWGSNIFLQAVGERSSSSSSTAATHLRGLVYFRGPILPVEPWGRAQNLRLRHFPAATVSQYILHRSSLLLHANIPTPDLLDYGGKHTRNPVSKVSAHAWFLFSTIMQCRDFSLVCLVIGSGKEKGIVCAGSSLISSLSLSFWSWSYHLRNSKSHQDFGNCIWAPRKQLRNQIALQRERAYCNNQLACLRLLNCQQFGWETGAGQIENIHLQQLMPV